MEGHAPSWPIFKTDATKRVPPEKPQRTVAIGLLDRIQVHPREVFADVIADRAAAVIFAHNHPSGDSKPSAADLAIHDQLTQAANILGIRVLDHIIVAKTDHYSYQEAGVIP